MNRMAMAGAVVAVLVAAAGCPAGECQTNADCAQGKICNSTNVCSDPNGPLPAQDASQPPPRDASRVDGSAADSASQDLVGIDGGGTQVTSFAACSGVRALAYDSSQDQLLVACETADTIVVYDAVTGVQQRELTSLPVPCKPRALHLLANRQQLWVACSDSGNQKVFNTDPQTGASNESGFGYTGIGGSARFASSADRLVWTDASGSSYHLRAVGSATTSSLVADGSGLNLGNGVAMMTTGEFFMTNFLTANGNITRRDKTNGVLTNYIAATINNQLIAYSAVRSVLIIASNAAYSRMNAASGTVIGSAQNFGPGTSARALVVHPGGQHAFLARYSSSTASTLVDEISLDPADDTPTISTRSLGSCYGTDLAAAADGRVFVACANSNRIEVQSF